MLAKLTGLEKESCLFLFHGISNIFTVIGEHPPNLYHRHTIFVSPGYFSCATISFATKPPYQPVVLLEEICTMCGMFMFSHLPFAKLCKKSIVVLGTFFTSGSSLDAATAPAPTGGVKCACASSSRIMALSYSSSCFCLSCCKIASTKNVVREPWRLLCKICHASRSLGSSRFKFK